MNIFPSAEPGREVIPFFADMRVRQAVAYGTNRQQMADQILYGAVDVMNSTLPPDHPAWNAETARLYPYDPQRAAALLEDAGWADRDGDDIREAVRDLTGEVSCGRGAWRIPAGTPFEVRLQVTMGDALREQIVRQFQDDMRALGIRVSIELLPGAPRYTNLASQRTFQIRQAEWTSSLDPATWLGGGGVNIYRTPEGEAISAYDLWQQRGDALDAGGLTYEQFAFGQPVERREDATRRADFPGGSSARGLHHRPGRGRRSNRLVRSPGGRAVVRQRRYAGCTGSQRSLPRIPDDFRPATSEPACSSMWRSPRGHRTVRPRPRPGEHRGGDVERRNAVHAAGHAVCERVESPVAGRSEPRSHTCPTVHRHPGFPFAFECCHLILRFSEELACV
jgi:hypothetical protein